ncbi:MAG: sulfurtransferase complex subunit TusB [Candidatus Hermodarchaeota archaeon]
MMEKENKILYLFGFSPNKGMQLENLIKVIAEQVDTFEVSLVLLHDGVIGLSNKGILPKTFNNLFALPIKIYALIPDVKARGINIEDINNRVSCIDYDELVDLLSEIPRIASWM